MHAVEIRAAAPAEASAISRLLASAIRDSYSGLLGSTDAERLVSRHCPLTRINAEIGVPGGAPGWLGWLVAVDADGTVLGAAAGGVPLTGQGELYALCTPPSRRREGLGSRLLAATTDRMRTHEALHQSLSLPIPQDPALPFYARHGFTGSGTRLARTL